ncbi:MAG: VWA domain-containing protein [Gammaproteobacteria bacterium]
MLSFALPWILALAPLPFIIRRLLRPVDVASQVALKIPGAERWAQGDNSGAGRSRWFLLLLAFLVWLLLVVSAARPQWLGETRALPVSGRDLLLAVDVSGSMRLRDFRVNNRIVTRLDATKYVATEFIRERKGDRVGLILFGRQAYLQTPLTFDRRTVSVLLGEAFIGIAGNETAIGDAIGLAIKRLRDKPADSRVLVLLTDGANTAGAIDPLRAASLAAREGVKVYTIGIGADRDAGRSLFNLGRQSQSSSLDEKTLRAIASETGGRYFRARDTRELNEIYTTLDKLEPADFETQGFRPVKSLFYWPLGLALGIAAFATLVNALISRRSVA